MGMNEVGRLIAITFVSVVLASFAANTTAFAQAGSAGGTVGKQDKSISGGEDTEPQNQPKRTLQRRGSTPTRQTTATHHAAQSAPSKASRPIGCFRDTNAPLDIDGYIERSRANTPGRCVSICKSKGFRYAGVQYGESCLCGNSYGRYGAASNCNMACTGNSDETCGGGFANYVYATGVP